MSKLTDDGIENWFQLVSRRNDASVTLRREDFFDMLQELRASRRAKAKVKAALIALREMGNDYSEVKARETLADADVKEWLG